MVDTVELLGMSDAEKVLRGLLFPDGVARRSTRLTRITRVAAAARLNNPFRAPVMASPPTVSVAAYANSGSLPAGINKFYNLPAQVDSFNFFGGDILDPTASTYGIVSGTYPSGGNLGNGKNALAWAVEMGTDAAKICLRLTADPTSGWFRLIVDGQYANKSWTQLSAAGGAMFVTVDFGSRANRTITLECGGNTKFGGAVVGQLDSLWAPARDSIVRMAWVGDSFPENLAGKHNTYTWGGGHAEIAAKSLGIRNLKIPAIGGTGYVNPGARWKFADHITDWINWNPDIVVFGPFTNDSDAAALGTTQAAVADAALALWQATRAALPNATIFVSGLLIAPTTTAIAFENLFAARHAAWGDPNSKFIRQMTDPAGPWIFGDGNGYDDAPTGVGNVDIYRGDKTHLNHLGDEYVGQRYAAEIYAYMQSFA